MQFLHTFYLYINTGDIKGIMMFLSTFQNSISFSSNPFAMGLMSMNPRMDFFMGMAAATSPVAFGGSVFNYASPVMNFGYNNPFAFTPNFGGFGMLPQMPVMPTLPQITFPTVSMLPMPQLMPMPIPSFGSITVSSSRKVEPQGATDDYGIEKYATPSKIKPGLLKGNLKGKEGVITALCEKYGVDIALVVSIIGQESGFGTSNLAKHNNFMGYRAAGDLGKSSKGFGYFSTPEKGLEAAIKNIAKYPQRYAAVKKADMNNIDSIGKIYCEGSSYASSIKNIYNTTVKSFLA